MNKEFPWLDEKGQALSDTDLKEAVKTWNPETWERYLKTIEINQKERQIHNEEYFDDRAEKIQISTLFQNIETDKEYIHFKEILDKSIQSLCPKQKTVITGLYFGNLSMRQLAKELKISHTAVSKIRNRAIENLKFFIEKNYLSNKCKNGNQVETVSTQVSISPLYEGIIKLITKLNPTKTED